MYAAPNLDLLWKDDLSLMEFPKENLKFLEKLGEGQFGEVLPVKLLFPVLFCFILRRIIQSMVSSCPINPIKSYIFGIVL